MRPPHECGGKPGTVATGSDHGPAFNEAPARMRGKTCTGSTPRRSASSFNEAPARMRGKTMDEPSICPASASRTNAGENFGASAVAKT